MKLDENRREYRYGRLDRDSLEASPYRQFDRWMQQALEAGIGDPTAMTVSTVDADGKPWSRIVLLKGFDDAGFTFYTSLVSRKGREIEENPNVCLHFPWLSMDRQVIVGGTARVLDHEASEAYFESRPRESRIGAWVAEQSSTIPSREFLDQAFNEASERFEGKDVPMPEHWGGYKIEPVSFEFWQGGEHRLHDRFEYTLAGGEWQIRRLAP